MPVEVPVYFDYASCLCYIAWCIGQRLEAETGVRLRWRPVHIATQLPQWRPGARISDDARAKIERVARETGTSLRIPRRWLDSRAALEGATFAEERGRASAYHAAVFSAAYESGEDIGDRTVLVRSAERAGLPVDGFMDSLANGRAAGQLAHAIKAAGDLGVVGYPTFLLGEFALTGIQPYDTMRLLIGRHIERVERGLH